MADRSSSEPFLLPDQSRVQIHAISRVGASEVQKGTIGILRDYPRDQEILSAYLRAPGARAPVLKLQHPGRVEKELSGDESALLAWCAQAGITCVDPTPILGPDDYFALDAHWTPAGHGKGGGAGSAVC